MLHGCFLKWHCVAVVLLAGCLLFWFSDILFVFVFGIFVSVCFSYVLGRWRLVVVLFWLSDLVEILNLVCPDFRFGSMVLFICAMFGWIPSLDLDSTRLCFVWCCSKGLGAYTLRVDGSCWCRTFSTLSATVAWCSSVDCFAFLPFVHPSIWTTIGFSKPMRLRALFRFVNGVYCMLIFDGSCWNLGRLCVGRRFIRLFRSSEYSTFFCNSVSHLYVGSLDCPWLWLLRVVVCLIPCCTDLLYHPLGFWFCGLLVRSLPPVLYFLFYFNLFSILSKKKSSRYVGKKNITVYSWYLQAKLFVMRYNITLNTYLRSVIINFLLL